jgi:hypothetical protein
MRPRAPSFDVMPDIAAGPGSRGVAVRLPSRLPSTLVTRSEPTPCHVEQPIRAIRRCLPRPCRRKRREGKMPPIERCNRPAGRAPERTARFLVPSARWRRRLTPRLQLRVCLRRSPAGVPRSEERRTGAAPRCSGVFGRAQRSKLDPLTSPVPTGLWSPTGRADSAVPPSRGTPSSAQGAFHRQVLPASLARRRRPATVPGALPPPGRLPAPRRSSLSLGRAGPAASSGVHHPGAGQVRRACRLLQPPRSSSTTTEGPTTPRATPGLPPAQRFAGSRASGRTTGRAVSEPGTAEDAMSSPAPPHAMARRGALPRPDRLGHLLSRVRACVGRRAGRRMRDESPRNRRQPARSAVCSRAAAATPPRRGA